MTSEPTIPNEGNQGAEPVEVFGHGFTVSAEERSHVVERLEHVHRYSGGVERYEVGLFREPNPRLAKLRDRVEITGIGPGVTVRVHASGPRLERALAAALAKLETRLHRHHDRRLEQQQGTGHQDPVIDTTA
ncbi:HPF/RaiA family ribosome-associated protein [Pseudonocardia sp. NPDC049154]|jgi:ribosomal subunit interface protein|uniref:HPF/RaiA family ribosome-associated protein n=1 Tax=Pseudonocardia sp. NPDC049154 TaxID=3155501 RepID=UPI0033F39F33